MNVIRRVMVVAGLCSEQRRGCPLQQLELTVSPFTELKGKSSPLLPAPPPPPAAEAPWGWAAEVTSGTTGYGKEKPSVSAVDVPDARASRFRNPGRALRNSPFCISTRNWSYWDQNAARYSQQKHKKEICFTAPIVI